MNKAYSLFRTQGGWLWLPDLPVARKWTQLIDPVMSLPAKTKNLIQSFFTLGWRRQDQDLQVRDP